MLSHGDVLTGIPTDYLCVVIHYPQKPRCIFIECVWVFWCAHPCTQCLSLCLANEGEEREGVVVLREKELHLLHSTVHLKHRAHTGFVEIASQLQGEIIIISC